MNTLLLLLLLLVLLFEEMCNILVDMKTFVRQATSNNIHC